VEAGLLDIEDALFDDSACGVPVSVQIKRLTEELADRRLGGVSVAMANLLDLPEVERDVAVDAVVAGLPSPFVILGDRLICSGSVDVPAVLDALG
jgi:hypothetical protein